MTHNDAVHPQPGVRDSVTAELAHAEHAFNQAMVSNDIAQIRDCITDDWVIVTPEVGIVPAARILHVIETGQLRHDTMTKESGRVKVYGDVALVTARGHNTGQFQGQPLSADEWITDVYTRVNGRWRCVLTHLTPVAT